ncbi:MAG: hypothetical protein [Cressdnaviricota sp.]|nr:MAG: hypothetical protein [Cressdnaviricota sp.]
MDLLVKLVLRFHLRLVQALSGLWNQLFVLILTRSLGLQRKWRLGILARLVLELRLYLFARSTRLQLEPTFKHNHNLVRTAACHKPYKPLSGLKLPITIICALSKHTTLMLGWVESSVTIL